MGKSTAWAVDVTYDALVQLQMSSQTSNEIFLVNPYQSHPSLTPVEAEVLWEYAKLAQNLRMVCLSFDKNLKNIYIAEFIEGDAKDPSSP